MDRLAVLKRLAEDFSDNLDDFGAQTTFEDLRMDSYAVVDYLLEVEKEFSIVLNDDEILQLRSIQDVLDTIEQSI
jgi:acyl carrier protein